MKNPSIYLSLTLLACSQPESTIIQEESTDSFLKTAVETRKVKERKPDFKMYPLYSTSLDDGRIIRSFEAVDSTREIKPGIYERKEYFKVAKKTESGEKVIKPMTNFLDNLCNSYSAVTVIENDFKVLKECNTEIPRIEVTKESEDQYFLTYFSDSLVFSKMIIYSRNVMGGEINEHHITEYNGHYIHLWLKDTLTGMADEEFVAIGGSGVNGVYEFFIPYKKQRVPHYFTKTRKLETGRIETVEDECL